MADPGGELLASLRGGDRRSIGRADEVAATVLRAPALFGRLLDGMLDEDPVVRMRAADAAEKVSARRPDLLAEHQGRLLGAIAEVTQQEVCWHVAQMLPRLALSAAELNAAVELLYRYLDHDSRIVRQALADLAGQHPRLVPVVLPLVERLAREGSAAMRVRGRRLVTQLKRVSA